MKCWEMQSHQPVLTRDVRLDEMNVKLLFGCNLRFFIVRRPRTTSLGCYNSQIWHPPASGVEGGCAGACGEFELAAVTGKLGATFEMLN